MNIFFYFNYRISFKQPFKFVSNIKDLIVKEENSHEISQHKLDLCSKYYFPF